MLLGKEQRSEPRPARAVVDRVGLGDERRLGGEVGDHPATAADGEANPARGVLAQGVPRDDGELFDAGGVGADRDVEAVAGGVAVAVADLSNDPREPLDRLGHAGLGETEVLSARGFKRVGGHYEYSIKVYTNGMEVHRKRPRGFK